MGTVYAEKHIAKTDCSLEVTTIMNPGSGRNLYTCRKKILLESDGGEQSNCHGLHKGKVACDCGARCRGAINPALRRKRMEGVRCALLQSANNIIYKACGGLRDVHKVVGRTLLLQKSNRAMYRSALHCEPASLKARPPRTNPQKSKIFLCLRQNTFFSGVSEQKSVLHEVFQSFTS